MKHSQVFISYNFSVKETKSIRWIEISNSMSKALKIISKDKLSFSALHFTDEAVWNATHDFNLEKIREPQVYLNLDCIQQGLGNATCGPNPLPKYMIPENQPLSFSFRLQPIE